MNWKRIVRGGQVPPEKAEQARKHRKRETQEEKALWKRLRGDQLKGLHFRRQQVIRGFIVDFYCTEAGLVVEVDGPGHQSEQDFDRERDEVLVGLGLRVIRFTNREVQRDMENVLATILREARNRQEFT